MYKYHINVFYCEDDGDFIADVPDLRGCSAFGDTPEQAIKEAMIAIELWIDAANSMNKEIPEPKYRPAIYAAR
ncbi:MAG: type II toxin-antitoxin system HicB family antitoxin [Defluviitaleaceae bacterium]|nr:type II toxin-antitoxin system HicB family antitoxin [Defluviitaleaceae bacterium]